MSVWIVTVMMLALQAAVPTDANSLTVEQQAAADGALRYYRVAAGDLDGDGKADKAELSLRCEGGLAADATLTPIAAAGKRQHKPMAMAREWGAASAQLAAAKVGYNVKKVEGTGAKTVSSGIPVTLIGSGPLCSLATILR